MADFGAALSDLGGAVTDLFGARGARSAGKSYDEAKRIAEENALLVRQQTKVKGLLLQRQITKSLGTTEAGIAGAGFAKSGSGLDILRSSAEQGAIAKALNEEQGAITVNSYRAQANQFGGMAEAARSSATGQDIAAILNLAGAAFNGYSGVMGLFGGGAGAGAAAGAGAEGAGAADLIGIAAALA